MSMEEHTPSVDDEGSATIAALGAPAEAAAAVSTHAGDEDGDDAAGSSAARVIPTQQLWNGLEVAKGLWSRARKSLDESQAMQKVKEATKPVTTAIVDGAKAVGEAAKPLTSAVVDGAKIAGAQLHAGAEAAKPQLEKGLHAVQQAGEKVVQQAKPALQHAGEAIKTTTHTVVEKIQDLGKGGGKGGDGGGGGGQPPHTV